MTWYEILLLTQDRLGEDVLGTENFFKQHQLKLAAAMVQLEASGEIKCLEADSFATIPLVSGQELHAAPDDMIEPRAIKYEDLLYLKTQFRRKPTFLPTNRSSSPTSFYLQNKKIGVYPAVNSAGKYIYIWYWRLAPPYGFRITDTNTDSTTVTMSVASDKITVTIVGGVNAGEFVFDFATNTTIDALVPAINSSSRGLLAEKNSSCLGARPSTDLEIITSGDFSRISMVAFFPPELPEEMHREILMEAMLEAAWDKNGKRSNSRQSRETYKNSILLWEAEWRKRYASIGPERVADAYFNADIEEEPNFTRNWYPT